VENCCPFDAIVVVVDSSSCSAVEDSAADAANDGDDDWNSLTAIDDYELNRDESFGYAVAAVDKLDNVSAAVERKIAVAVVVVAEETDVNFGNKRAVESAALFPDGVLENSNHLI
jgi:hypothetical protein